MSTLLSHSRRARAPVPESFTDAAATCQPPTPRLGLRALEAGDVEDLYALFSDSQAMRYWNEPVFQSRDDASIYLDAVQREVVRGDLCQWAIALAGTGQLVGTGRLARIDARHGRADVSFFIARGFWGRRYGREALGLLLDHAFNELGLRRLEADVDPRNLPTLETLEALGFRREGYLRQRWQVNGETQDSILLGLLDSEHFGRA